MAQVFGCFKGTEVPLPLKGPEGPDCVLVKEEPVEIAESRCDHEHVSHGYDLLAYYKFHVRGIENLLSHHEDTERKLKETERKLKESEKSRKALADRLENTEKDLKSTKDTLVSTQKQLKDTQSELDKNRNELTKTTKELQDTRKKLNETSQALETSEKALCKARQDLKEKTAALSKAQEEYQTLDEKHKATLQDLETANVDLLKAREAYKKVDKQYGEQRELTKKAQTERNTAVAKVEELEGQIEDLKNQINDLQAEGGKGSKFIHHDDRKRGKFYIDEVMYGGKVISDKAVLSKLLDFAVKGEEFLISNTLMGGDPWHHNTKTFTAVYAIDGKGPFRYISQREHQKTKFYDC